MINKFFLLFIVLISSLDSFADIQQRISIAERDYISSRFLNAVFMFADDNTILLRGAKGLFALNGEQLNANELMPIASSTKPMTAAAILRLQDRKLLSVQDKINKYIDPQIWGKKEPEWTRRISIHNLLTHTSGLAEYFNNVTLDLNMSQQEINKTILRYVASKPLEVPIGKRFKHSNTDFIILGMIIEKVSKKSLRDFFQQEFFIPLNMKSTNLASFSEAVRIQKNVVNSNYPIRYYVTPTNNYKPIFVPVNIEFLAVPYADGGVISTTHDLIKWYRALNRGKVLSQKSYKLMTSKYFLIKEKQGQKTYTGYGIYLTELDKKHIMIHHPGNAIGIRAETGYILPNNLYFAILSNTAVRIPEEEKDKIDMNNLVNQLDIIYFRDVVINAAIKEQTAKL